MPLKSLIFILFVAAMNCTAGVGERHEMSPETPFKLVVIEEAKEPAKSVLRQKAPTVTFPLSPSDRAIVQALKTQTVQLGGVGLAAPQIGKSRRITAIYIPEDTALIRDDITPYPVHVLINPSYEPIEEEGIYHDFEGCYSVQNTAGKVPRYKAVRVSYQDEDGKRHEGIERGLYARVIQHEVDHLNGYLLTDRLTPDCVQGTMEEMMALRRKELSPEKRALLEKLLKEKEQARKEAHQGTAKS